MLSLGLQALVSGMDLRADPSSVPWVIFILGPDINKSNSVQMGPFPDPSTYYVSLNDYVTDEEEMLGAEFPLGLSVSCFGCHICQF